MGIYDNGLAFDLGALPNLRDALPRPRGARLSSSQGRAGNTALAFDHLHNRLAMILSRSSGLSLVEEQQIVNAMDAAGDLLFRALRSGRGIPWDASGLGSSVPPPSPALEALALEASAALWLARPGAQNLLKEFLDAIGLGAYIYDARTVRMALGFFGRLYQQETPSSLGDGT